MPEVYVPGQQYVGQGIQGAFSPVQSFSPGAVVSAGAAVLKGAGYLVNLASGAQSTASQYMGSGTGEPQFDSQNGNVYCPPRKRRRRRKLLTCGDKADIAFLHGQLGSGQLGRSAISALLSRRCG